MVNFFTFSVFLLAVVRPQGLVGKLAKLRTGGFTKRGAPVWRPTFNFPVVHPLLTLALHTLPLGPRWGESLLEGLMSNLVLELRPGEVMIVNGAPIRFRTKSRIELTAQVRFMFGKQIMPPDQANSPARRIYYALQSSYIGEEDEREANLESARYFIEEFQRATTLKSIKQTLTLALMAAEEDNFHLALKLTRLVLKHENAILGATADIVPATVSSVAECVGMGRRLAT